MVQLEILELVFYFTNRISIYSIIFINDLSGKINGFGSVGSYPFPYTATEDTVFVVNFQAGTTGVTYVYIARNGNNAFHFSGSMQAGYWSSLSGVAKKGDVITLADSANASNITLTCGPFIKS